MWSDWILFIGVIIWAFGLPGWLLVGDRKELGINRIGLGLVVGITIWLYWRFLAQKPLYVAGVKGVLIDHGLTEWEDRWEARGKILQNRKMRKLFESDYLFMPMEKEGGMIGPSNLLIECESAAGRIVRL